MGRVLIRLILIEKEIRGVEQGDFFNASESMPKKNV